MQENEEIYLAIVSVEIKRVSYGKMYKEKRIFEMVYKDGEEKKKDSYLHGRLTRILDLDVKQLAGRAFQEEYKIVEINKVKKLGINED